MPETQNPGVAVSLCCRMLVNSDTMVWPAADHAELCEQQSIFKLTEGKWWNYLFTVIFPCAIIGFPLFKVGVVITKENGWDRMDFCSAPLPTGMCSGES